MNFKTLKQRCRDAAPGVWSLASYVYWHARLSTPWTETDFFKRLRAVRSSEVAPGTAPDRARRVLFFATRQERDQLGVVTTLALALERRGHRLMILACDGALLHSCNSGQYPTLSRWTCRTCHRYARQTHTLSGVPTTWLTDTVPPGARARAERAVAALAPDQFAGFAYRDFHIGRYVRISVAHFLRTSRLFEDALSIAVYRAWLTAGMWLVDVCEALLDRERPDVVVLLNGLFAPEWIMLEACRRRGVRVVSWEIGFRPETLIFFHDRPTDMADNALWPAFRDVPLSAAENTRLDQYLAERNAGGGYVISYFPNLEASADAICAEFGIDRSRKTIVLFPNITWDSTTFEQHVGFSGVLDWIYETIRYFADHPETQLVIRVHPAEAILASAGRDPVMKLIAQAFPELPKNVVIIPPTSGASSYVLMDLAHCGIVYGSTTGLEMGVRGIPVITAGQIYYRGHGFTFDAESRQHYRQILSDLLEGRIPHDDPARLEAWRRYAYFTIFRCAVPLHQVAYQRIGDEVKLRYHGAEDLDPGRDPNLDTICRGITRGTPFVAIAEDPPAEAACAKP